MEPINQISIESFSYGWLGNINPTFDRLEDSLRRSFEAHDSSSFIEMDPDFFSMRWIESKCFDFSLPSSSEPSNLVHADQIFSNGQLLPSSTLKANEPCISSNSALTRSVSINSSKKLISERNHWDDSISIYTSPPHFSSYNTPLNSGVKKLKMPLYINRKTSPTKILKKYLNFLIHFYKKVKKLKMMNLRTTRSCGDSPINSVKMKNEFSSIERNRGGRVNRVFDLGFECPIHDAVLYCKKSFINSNGEA